MYIFIQNLMIWFKWYVFKCITNVKIYISKFIYRICLICILSIILNNVEFEIFKKNNLKEIIIFYDILFSIISNLLLLFIEINWSFNDTNNDNSISLPIFYYVIYDITLLLINKINIIKLGWYIISVYR